MSRTRSRWMLTIGDLRRRRPPGSRKKRRLGRQCLGEVTATRWVRRLDRLPPQYPATGRGRRRNIHGSFGSGRDTEPQVSRLLPCLSSAGEGNRDPELWAPLGQKSWCGWTTQQQAKQIYWVAAGCSPRRKRRQVHAPLPGQGLYFIAWPILQDRVVFFRLTSLLVLAKGEGWRVRRWMVAEVGDMALPFDC